MVDSIQLRFDRIRSRGKRDQFVVGNYGISREFGETEEEDSQAILGGENIWHTAEREVEDTEN